MIKIKILHTSDWHIGRRLHEHERLDEMKKFFSWLKDLIQNENIDVLLVAGDIFDNTTPSNQARELYFSFLAEIAKSCCRHVIIISGNHDSPTFLDAPSKTLELLNIHVVGQASENPEDEIFILKNSEGNPELMACAVPFLRDRDVRTVKADDNFEDRQEALINGIYFHYTKVFEKAIELKGKLKIPLISTGHLFIKDALVCKEGNENDEEAKKRKAQKLYVGTLVQVGLNLFPPYVNYVALGHLHSKQGSTRIRYSGSPIPMSFGEADLNKFVCIVEFDEKNHAQVKDIEVPVFKKLARIKGDWNLIESKLKDFINANEPAWLEITYNGKELIDVQERVDGILEPYPEIKALSVYDETREDFNKTGGVEEIIIEKSLDEISPIDIFNLRLKSVNEIEIPKEQRELLLDMYHEILNEVNT